MPWSLACALLACAGPVKDRVKSPERLLLDENRVVCKLTKGCQQKLGFRVEDAGKR